MSWNESGSLPKLSILAATLVRFHLFICTTIMRVGVTQIRVTDATHRTNNLRVTLAATVNEGRVLWISRLDIVGFSPHLCPLVELATAPVVTTRSQRLFL